ncbi:MAG: 7-cyano-7-deazaguanine synthase QueC [Deltaproteobacteria bacterium]|nr:7-cyano-7-deazaguanine synthase QueC [Deltaproteobacteria bacterium]
MSSPETSGKTAIVLLSGGLDSSTVLAIAQSRGFLCHAISFRYGQRHAVELEAAREVAKVRGVKSHRVVDVDLRAFGGSALTDDAIAVPKGREAREMSAAIPVTYVPARNTIFLSFALALAEVENARDIFVGVNAVDYSGYPDCRPEYLAAFEVMANLATKIGVEAAADAAGRIRLQAPLVTMSKADIIREGTRLGVDYGLTWSCYDPQASPAGPRACGQCDSCLIRQQGFVDAGVSDPTRYL